MVPGTSRILIGFLINTFSEAPVNSKKFTYARKKLNKTQKQMAELLGTSVKAVHSYEQGWRKVPAHVERQVYFLATRRQGHARRQKSCWTLKKCPTERKKMCPAWEFQAGDLCWFINGTICEGTVQADWNKKMKMCRNCEVLEQSLNTEAGNRLSKDD